MTSVSSNVYIAKLDDIINKYNKTYYGNVKMGPVNVKSSTYIDKVKNTVPWTYVVTDLNGVEIVGSFYEKWLPKTNQKELKLQEVIQIKSYKIYVKWKGCNDSFNCCIDKKEHSIHEWIFS